MAALRRGAHVGRYRIEGLLGRGGMGEVHLAFDEEMKRRVALKTVQQTGALAPDATTLGRLRREARAAGMLNHPNAVHVFDIGETSQVTYIAMELVEGSTLRAHMSNLTLSTAVKLGWLHAVASVLAAAHAAGLVHRDIKPENIMIRRDGVVKVLDFGAVKRVNQPGAATIDRTHDLTAEGLVVGTPAYMAPEAFERVVGPGTDQFAWGVVAYELLAARHPFQRPPGIGHYEWLCSHDPTPLHRVAKDVPRSVADIVMRALAKNPASRFSSMAELAGVLESNEALGDATIETPAAAPPPEDDAPTLVAPQRRHR